MTKGLIFLLLLMSPFIGMAQVGTISGKVLDGDTNEALIGATVLVEGENVGSIVDLEGNFLIENVPVGDQVVLVTFVGYEDLKRNVTVREGQNSDLGSISISVSAIGLKEVQVFSGFIDDKVSVSTVSSISAEDIDTKYADVEIAEIASTTPGVYTVQGAGGYGDESITFRGFENPTVSVNGITVNDQESNFVFWSNLAALRSAAREFQVQRGLAPSRVPNNAIGGAINIVTSPTDSKAGGKLELQSGTGTWNNRLQLTLHTGQLDNGWAVSFKGSRTTTSNGLVGISTTANNNTGSLSPGAFVDAYFYYLAVSKRINSQHQITFTGFGAPLNRGTAFRADELTREEFNIENRQFNNALGVYRGDFLNARQNKVHSPLFSLNHFWDLDANTSLSTSLYYTFTDAFSTQPRDSQSSLFFPVRNITDDEFTPEGLIDFDFLSTQNRLSPVTIDNPGGDPNAESVTGFASRYFLEARFNNSRRFGFISNFRKKINRLRILGGINLASYQAAHFVEVFDLLGGDFVLNQSPFGDEQNSLRPNAIARVGDRFNYDYDITINRVSGFGQATYELEKFTIFASSNITSNWYTRTGNFLNDRDINRFNSLGNSETRNFIASSIRTGFNWRPTNRHKFKVIGGFFTRAPTVRNAFEDVRFSNQFLQGLTTEKVAAIEAGYNYRTSKLKVGINGYYTQFKDRTLEINIDDFDPLTQNQTRTPLAINGLEAIHEGVEVDIEYNVLPSLELSGNIAIGDWRWTNNGQQTITRVTNAGIETEVIEGPNISGLQVGRAAQTTVNLGLHYRGIRNFYIGSRLQYADRIAISYSPSDIQRGFISREVIENGFDDYATVSVYAGRYFNVSDKIRGRITANVSNLFDSDYVRFASFFFNQTQLGFGFPRTYTLGLNFEF